MIPICVWKEPVMTRKKPNNPVPLDDQVCYAIYSAGLAIQRVYKPLLDRLGLTYPQYLVLNVLWREDKQTVGSIADRLALESSTLTPAQAARSRWPAAPDEKPGQ